MTLIGIFYKSEEIAYFLRFVRSRWCVQERIMDRRWDQYSLILLPSTSPVKINVGNNVLYGLSDSRLKLQNGWNDVFWNASF